MFSLLLSFTDDDDYNYSYYSSRCNRDFVLRRALRKSPHYGAKTWLLFKIIQTLQKRNGEKRERES
jgi:hypothetical protein